MDPALIVAIVLVAVAVVVAALLGRRAGRRRRQQRLIAAEASGPRTETYAVDSEHLDDEPAEPGAGAAGAGGRSVDPVAGSADAPTPPAGSPQPDPDPGALTVELPVTSGKAENAVETTADIPRVGSDEFPLDGSGRPAIIPSEEPGPAAHREPAPSVEPEPREQHGGRHRAPAGAGSMLGRRGQPGRTGQTGGFRIPAARQPGETTRPTQAAVPAEAIRAETPREDIFRADARRADVFRADAPHEDVVRADAPREQVAQERPWADVPRTEAPWVEPVRMQPPRVEPPRMEPVQTGPAWIDDPQSESPPLVTPPVQSRQELPVDALRVDSSWPQAALAGSGVPNGSAPETPRMAPSQMEPAHAGTQQGGAPRWEFPVARFEAEMSRGAVARQTEAGEADAPPTDDPAAGGPRRDPEPAVAAQPEQLYPSTGRSGGTPARGAPPVEADLFRANTQWSSGFGPGQQAPAAGWAPGGGDGSSAVDLDRAGEPTTLIPAARAGSHDEPVEHGEPVAAAKGPRRSLADRLRGRNR